MCENATLLKGLLRGEWKYSGAIISDFEGIYSLKPSVDAGLDVEMPGPALYRGKHLIDAVNNGEISETQVDALAEHVLDLAAKVGMNQEKKPEGVSDNSDTAHLVYRIASEGIVLLKNDDQLLPLDPASKCKIAVFGTPANTPVVHGGGSASLTPSYIVSPLSALRKRFGEANVSYHPGVPIFKKIPSAPLLAMRRISDNKPGVDCYWYNGSVFGENLVHHETLETTRTLLIEPRIKELKQRHCSRMDCILTPETTGRHVFGVTACGATVLKVDGAEIISHPGFEDVKVEYILQPGDFEVRANVNMVGGREYHIVIDTLSTTAPNPSPVFTMAPQATQVGFYENLDSPASAEISKIASDCDISIVFTGNNKEYESESFDRDSMSLSPLQDEFVSIVAETAPKTVVINQTGALITMPWLGQVDVILQCWFAGQEVGNAVADVISGVVSRSGKLPVTFPKRIEDSPISWQFSHR
jgi:beta-glucosidase